MDKSYDTIIIGAGIIGCNGAFELAKKGSKTLNIDKLEYSGQVCHEIYRTGVQHWL
jgi:sarcosine oxidase subunit beta